MSDADCVFLFPNRSDVPEVSLSFSGSPRRLRSVRQSRPRVALANSRASSGSAYSGSACFAVDQYSSAAWLFPGRVLVP